MAVTAPFGTGVATEVVRARLQTGRRDWPGFVFQAVLLVTLCASVLILVVLLAEVLAEGWSVLTSDLGRLLTNPLRAQPSQAGLAQGLWGTFWIAMFVVVFAFPIGIAAGVYLEEYAPKNRLTNLVNVNIRNLAGVPSVVYGILGLAIFVKALGSVTGPGQSHGKTVVSAGLTLAALVLPIVIITSVEAIRAVPTSLREAGFGVGATHWEVIRKEVLPYAAPGVLTGTVLALARAIGEAAPLILIGAVTNRLGSEPGFLDLSALRDRFTALPIVITEWTQNSKPGFDELAAAGIAVMLVFVLAFNSVAIVLRNRFEKKRG
jgi:phosphate transport system permease protein